MVVDSRLSGSAKIQDRCYLEDVTLKGDDALIMGNSVVQHCTLSQGVMIGDHMNISGITISGRLKLCGDIKIETQGTSSGEIGSRT